jgi:hypothetical protein
LFVFILPRTLFYLFIFTFLTLDTQEFLFRSHFKQWDDDGRSREYLQHARGTFEFVDSFRSYSNTYDGFQEGDYYQEIAHHGEQVALEFHIDNMEDKKGSPFVVKNTFWTK